METIKFTFEETNEEVTFAVIGSIEHDGEVYVLVVEEDDMENDDMTAYIMKAVEEDGEDIIYEIVEDDDELAEVSAQFDEILENFEIEQD